MILDGTLRRYSQTPITFQYEVPNQSTLEDLRVDCRPVVLRGDSNLVLDQTYFKMGLKGTSESTLVREAVAKRLEKIIKILNPHFGIFVFDAYRTIETQRSLMGVLFQQISKSNPAWTSDQVWRQTRTYVFDPDQEGGLLVPPHNSGGAIDLALHQRGSLVEFGTGFDSPIISSSTSYFEKDFDPDLGFSRVQWEEIRKNRRILYHSMISMGFTNYADEWWHYNLANFKWCAEFGIPEIYGSMEEDVRHLKQIKGIE